MEDILINIACYEYDLKKDFMFSNTRDRVVLTALSAISYILIVKKGWAVKRVHSLFIAMGYKKSEQSIYRHIRESKKKMEWNESFNNVIDRMLVDIDEAAERKVITFPKEESLHTSLGRVVSKLSTLKKISDIRDIEFLIDKRVQNNFIEAIDG